MRRWLPILVIPALVIPSCLKKDKSNNGPKGQDHELAIGAIQPSEGLTVGGEDVLIIGFNFQQDRPVTEVLFGTTPADAFTVRSNNQIDAVTPPHARGTVDITLRNADGDEAILQDGFTFHPLIRDCLTLDPTSGPDFGGTSVTIVTSSFTDDFTVDVPNVYFETTEAFSVTAVDPTTIIAVTPPGSGPGSVDVTVESADAFEICTFPLGFTYVLPGPCLTVQPDHGDPAGGYTVDVHGNGPCYWTPTSTVTFGGVRATNVTYVSASQIYCATPAFPAAGPVDVEVTGEDSLGNPCSCILPDGFTYYGGCAITSITPNSGGTNGGILVTISGQGFDPQCNDVLFGGVYATDVFVNGTGTQITCINPPYPSGDYVDVEVIPCIGGRCVIPAAFEYVAPLGGTCSITDVVPTVGPMAGGNPVVITGSGFDADAGVLFGNRPATVVSASATQISCMAPHADAPGLVDVVVAPGGSAPCVLVDAYEYR